MNRRGFLFSCILLFIFAISANGKTIKLLAIGNSFSEDGIEQYLYELAAEGGDTLIIGNIYRPGQSLEAHWKEITENKALIEYRKIVNGVKTNTKDRTLLEYLTDENWDYVTFQQASHLSGLPASYEPYLTYLIDYVRKHATNPNVKYGFQLTWAYAKDSTHGGFANYNNDQLTMYNAILNAVSKAIKSHQDVISFIIPSGIAIQLVRATPIGDTLNRDGYHLSYGTGRYTAACTWLAAITGQDPIGKKFKPDSITEAEAKVIQKVVHDVVFPK